MTRRVKTLWIGGLVLWASTAGHAVAQGDDPLAKVEDLLVNGRYAEAQVAAREAQQLYQAKGDRHGEALSILLRAEAERETENFAEAAADFERSAKMLEAAGDPNSAWMAWRQLGNLERLRKNPDAAFARFERSLNLVRMMAASSETLSFEGLNRLPRYFGLATSVHRLGLLPLAAGKSLLLGVAEGVTRAEMVATLLQTGRLEQAEAELGRLAHHSRTLRGALDGEVSIFRAELLRQQGRLDEARGMFREILELPKPVAEREKGNILEALTQIEVASGGFSEALKWNDQALALARRTGGPKEESAALVRRAQILREGDRLEVAASTLNEALPAARRSGSTSQQAWVHQEAGEVDLALDRQEKAAFHFEEAARLFHAIRQTEAEGWAWVQLFQIYSNLESGKAADAALEKVRALSKSSESRRLELTAELLAAARRRDVAEMEKVLSSLRALPELREGQRAKEGQALAELLSRIEVTFGGADSAISESNPGQGPLPDDSQELAQIVRGFEVFRRDEFAAARDIWLSSLVRGRLDQGLEVAALAGVAFSYIGEANPQEAIRYLELTVAAVERRADDVQLKEFLAGFLSNQQELFSLLIDLLAMFGRFEEAFDYTERARARAFLQELGTPRIQVRGVADTRSLREAEELRRKNLDIERRVVSASNGEREELLVELHKAREQYEGMLVRLKVTNPNQLTLAKLSPMQLRAVQAELPADTTLISYFVAPSHVRAWVLDRETFQSIGLFSLLPGQVDLGDLVCWAEELARLGGGRGAVVLGRPCAKAYSSEAVYEKLFAPLRPYIRHRRLVLVPHGELHYIPFAALRDPMTGRYLVEDYTLTYAPSASVLSQLRSKETPIEGRALVVGAPEELDPRLPSLPAAQTEAKRVARLLRTHPLLGAAATEGRFHELAGKADLLHVAAHGLYEPRNPIFSRIALTPDGEHDGNLEVHEIADLDLSGVNLVVLSACDTARGERSRGDEVTSLARAFLSAGSPGVLSTLWSIDDDAAEILMKELYRRLLAGASAAEALQQAQLSLLRSRRYSQPQFWAAFTLTGDPQGRWRVSR